MERGEEESSERQVLVAVESYQWNKLEHEGREWKVAQQSQMCDRNEMLMVCVVG